LGTEAVKLCDISVSQSSTVEDTSSQGSETVSFGENMFCSNVVPMLLWSSSARRQLQKDMVYYRNVHGGQTGEHDKWGWWCYALGKV